MSEEKKNLKELFDVAEGQWDDVIIRHFDYLNFYPKSATAYYNLGFAFAQRGQSQNAEVAFNKALEFKADMAEAVINLGGLYFGRQEWDKSIEYNKKAFKMQPALINAKLNVAYALFMKGEYDQAVTAFEELADHTDVKGAANYGLSNVHYELDNLKLSRKYFARAIELGVEPDPEFEKLLNDSKK